MIREKKKQKPSVFTITSYYLLLCLRDKSNEEALNPLKITECSVEDSVLILLLLFSAYALALVARSMLKRRPSKRFVLAESGEEGTWDTTMDNENSGKQQASMTSPVPPPVINLETAVPSGSTSASSSVSEDGPSGAGGATAGGVGCPGGELKVPALENLKLTESGRLK